MLSNAPARASAKNCSEARHSVQETFFQLVHTMSFDHQDGVEQKFWSSPELMENFLPFLNAQAVLCLARSQISCTLDILKDKENPSIWTKLIRRSVPEMPARYAWRDSNSEGGTPRENIVDARAIIDEKRAQILPVIAILKIMGGAVFHILSLLEVIGEKSPWDHISFGIQIACPGQESHYVSPLGFLLLEEVELAFGSVHQEILSIESGRRLWGLEELCLPVLASRVRRQPGRIDWFCIAHSFNCATRENAETLLTLIQNTETAKVRQVTPSVFFQFL